MIFVSRGMLSLSPSHLLREELTSGDLPWFLARIRSIKLGTLSWL